MDILIIAIQIAIWIGCYFLAGSVVTTLILILSDQFNGPDVLSPLNILVTMALWPLAFILVLAGLHDHLIAAIKQRHGWA
jgi:hypothetical protein